MSLNSSVSEGGFLQDQNKVRIYLEVNARELFSKPELDLGDIKLWDNQGNYAHGADVKEFSSDVFRGKKVEWKASVDETSEEHHFSIKIEQIEIIGENCLFNRVRLPGKKGKVKAEVKEFEGECNSTYAIWFSLWNEVGESVAFRLDPKLRGSTIVMSYSVRLQNFIRHAPIDQKLKDTLIEAIQSHGN